jgi:hypothetical protein
MSSEIGNSFIRILKGGGMKKYKQLHRTTLDKMGDGLPYSGIYVIAYLGKVLYIGKAEESVYARLKGHIYYRPDRVGRYLQNIEFDWENVLLDVLEPPDDAPANWIREAENVLIKRFQPIFNDQLLP